MTELETRLLEEVRDMNSYVKDIAEKQTTLTGQLNELAEQLELLAESIRTIYKVYPGASGNYCGKYAIQACCRTQPEAEWRGRWSRYLKAAGWTGFGLGVR